MNKKILYWFVILQPILDIYWFYNGKLATILPFTIPTIIRLIALFVLTVLFLKYILQDKFLIAYIALLVVFSGLHLYMMLHFAGDFGYSTTGEAFYLLRMMIPIAILFFTKYSNFSKENFFKAVTIVSLLFSLTVVISNLLIISLRSYETGQISGNIFMWYTNPNLGYSHIASKGFFNFSNMLSAVMLMLVPLVTYQVSYHLSKKTILVAIMHALAMIEIGTKIALAGVIIGFLVSYLALFIAKNRPNFKKTMLVIVAIEALALVTLPVGPVMQRYNYEKLLAKQSDDQTSQLNKTLKEKLSQLSGQAKLDYEKDFIKNNYQAYSLNPKFVLKGYPYTKDPEFWIKIMQEPGEARMNNRYLEKQMLKRASEKNGQTKTLLFGMGFMRQTNIFILERDFISQIYSLGIFGMLLLVGPSIVSLLLGLWKLWKTRDELIISTVLASAMILFAAYYSGNVLDFLTSSIILAFVNGFMLSYKKD
ncbi:MAG: O-antigen ligase family protein [Lactobacillus sp.]|nr:O-antigen ligase family protein [Lactobacillus sp.]